MPIVTKERSKPFKTIRKIITRIHNNNSYQAGNANSDKPK